MPPLFGNIADNFCTNAYLKKKVYNSLLLDQLHLSVCGVDIWGMLYKYFDLSYRLVQDLWSG
jgi:hypothetical protein